MRGKRKRGEPRENYKVGINLFSAGCPLKSSCKTIFVSLFASVETLEYDTQLIDLP